ncbi:hypothetical protein Cadr_000028461 [Camelus dromedarius]|uniref:Uncharacterized protein n=1 Tax=Camelus dromedarius TaxID=9838 RepID=A0A5N4CHG1_CAMDR|nr:hypothetical protein Cadr_000028461 [Camelus dromedarius]
MEISDGTVKEAVLLSLQSVISIRLVLDVGMRVEHEAEAFDVLMKRGVLKQEDPGLLNHRGKESCLLTRDICMDLSYE